MKKESIGFIPTCNTEDFLQKNGKTTTSDGFSYQGEDIIIDNSQLYPILKYRQIDSITHKESWIPIDGSDSPNRPAKMSDLDFILRKKDWMIGLGRKYVLSIDETTPTLCIFPSEKYSESIVSLIDSIKTNTESLFIVSDHDYTDAAWKNFEDKYEKLMKDDDMYYTTENGENVNLGASYYTNLISLRDVDKSSAVIDLLALSDSNYTNIINLSNIILQYEKENPLNNSYLITFGIDYTISGKIYSKEVSLVPVEEVDGDEGKEIKSSDLIIKISDDITLDYHNYCARVISSSSTVGECILSYCYMVYETKK